MSLRNCATILKRVGIRRALYSTSAITTSTKPLKWSYSHTESGELKFIGATIYERIEAMVSERPDSQAFKFSLTGESYTYKELKQRVDELAQSLLKHGYKRGDRLAIMLPNSSEYVLTTLAAASIGVVCVLLNPAYQLVEIEYMLKKTKSRGVVILDNLKTLKHYEILTQICPEMINSTGDLNSTKLPDLKHVFLVHNTLIKNDNRVFKGTLPFTSLTQSNTTSIEKPYVDMNDDFAMLFTSGSTGFPKAVPVTQHTVLNTSMIENIIPGIRETNRCINIPIPLFHIFGLVAGIISSVTNGNKVVFPNYFPDTLSIMKSIQEEKCTSMKGAPVIFIDLLHHPDLKKYDLSSLEAILLGASTVPKDLMIKIKEKLNLKHVIVGYGMTETGVLASLTTANDKNVSEKFAYESIGRVIPFLEQKIIDPKTGRILPVNEPGEMCFRGFNIMRGYLDDPKKTEECMDPNGWFKTGDIASMDEHGYVYFKTRSKELVIRGGVNIYPAEIERFLRTNDKVFDCYVVGVPDERVDEELCAWIKLKPGQSMTESEVKEYCKGKIAFFKIPRYVKFVDSFPVNATGKVQKFKMQEQMAIELKK